MKLQLNDVIQTNGFIMLKSIQGTLRVSKIDDISYYFTKEKGSKVICRHLISDIDSWINNNSDINYIKIVSK